MKKNNSFLSLALTVFLLMLFVSLTRVEAQQARYKMTTDIPASITTPDVVETSLGTLRFFDGFPDEATVKKVYDNLDFQRGVQVFLDALPVAQFHALRSGIRDYGPDNQTVLIAESLLDSRSLVDVANTETMYCFGWLDSNDGPQVVEIPANTLGFINDIWGRYVTDVGRAGLDKGQGGKYLLLPPDYAGSVPEGYFIVKSRTFGNSLTFRGFVVAGDLRSTSNSIKNQYKVYALRDAANPPEMKFVNISGQYFNTIPATDASFYEHVAQVVEEEPLEAVEPEMRGLLATIGIRKGKQFAPDPRMRGILNDAAAFGNATGRVLLFNTRRPDAFFYPNGAWQLGWLGNDPNWSPDGVLDPEARSLYFYFSFGVSPAMSLKMIGIGSQYALSCRDANGQYLNGSNSYRLHLPPDIPAKDFWSVVVYDPQTRSMLQTDQQFPSTSSQKKDIFINPDTSVDVYFGPEAPPGKETNWIQTLPDKGWFVILRLYGPLEPWFDKTWRPGEIELMK
jgi:hypothetical protein